MTSPAGQGHAILEVDRLAVRFGKDDATVHAARDVTFSVPAGQTVCLVGESGSGKTVSMLSVLGLLASSGRTEGTVRFDGEDIMHRPDRLRRLRGRRIGFVPQDPMNSLHPLRRIGPQVTEVLTHHRGHTKKQARERARELLGLVGLPDPDVALRSHPHQLSGGMRQRVCIAIALAGEPDLLVADEPTTALDVTVQAQIIELVNEMKASYGMGLVWVTHDMGVVANLADRVVVMYAGRVVEDGPVSEVIERPRHPYTKGLIGSVPQLRQDREEELLTIGGAPPDARALDHGCAFWPRCRYRLDERCESQVPPLREVAPGHWVASFYDLRAAEEEV